mmetsp:Transcript_61031/g.163716  ORF Transcript_61031/g.163716 Transcript_61031/m.163716 type:complete len:374 (+) Transcript_61031:968-2089(+)
MQPSSREPLPLAVLHLRYQPRVDRDGPIPDLLLVVTQTRERPGHQIAQELGHLLAGLLRVLPQRVRQQHHVVLHPDHRREPLVVRRRLRRPHHYAAGAADDFLLVIRGGFADLGEEFVEDGGGLGSDAAAIVRQHVEQALQQLREVLQHIHRRRRVQHIDPRHHQLSDVLVQHPRPLRQHRYQPPDVKPGGLRHDILHQPVQVLCPGMDGLIDVAVEFADAVEDLVEEGDELMAGGLGDVVHGLAGGVADLGLLVGEQPNHRQHKVLQVWGQHQRRPHPHCTAGQRNQAALAVVRVRGGDEVPGELDQDGLDLLVCDVPAAALPVQLLAHQRRNALRRLSALVDALIAELVRMGTQDADPVTGPDGMLGLLPG